MAPHPLVGIFLIGIIFSSSMTAGYNQVMDPLSGRTFSLLNLLPFQSMSTIQNSALVSRVATLETGLSSLTAQVASTTESCPPKSRSLGAQLIGTYCYAVIGARTANQKTFTAALADCQANGGSLAEPQVTREANRDFYNALRAKFLRSFTTIESSSNGGSFWIGYFMTLATLTDVISVTTGNTVPPPIPTYIINPLIIQLPPAPAVDSGVLINKPVTSTAASYWTTAALTTVNPYICQFTALA